MTTSKIETVSASLRVGLVGYGKAGQAVARVLAQAAGIELAWVIRRKEGVEWVCPDDQNEKRVLVQGLPPQGWSDWLDSHPVDALVDFSHADAVLQYGEEVRRRGLTLVAAISTYAEHHLSLLRDIGLGARVMSSPNITLGINFMLVAARLLRKLAPFADVEIVEQHFREKPEVSGTARIMAESLDLGSDKITSLRLGGIVGHHEVIFGFPHQTVRLVHDSIRREAFGTGALFALRELSTSPTGFYTFDDLLRRRMRSHLLADDF